jgi:FdhD protein
VHDSPARRPTTATRVTAIAGERAVERPDQLVTEEPMEIRVHGPGQEPRPLAVTMRTPGNDFELGVGFCVSEGVIGSADDLATVAYCLGPDRREQQFNIVTVKLRGPVDLAGRERNFVANASCGLCGKTTLDQLETTCAPVADGPTLPRSVLLDLPRRLRAAQSVFDRTGGLHAAGCFSTDGTATVVREDVGRHNAVDKIIGWATFERRLPLSDQVLVVSGRVSFEIVQKAAVAGIPIVCAVSAPSSLAVEAGARFGQTVVGFVRDDRANVYTRPERIDIGA